MAKTESTAVNELIGLVRDQKPMPRDPSDGLFSAPPARPSAPRMTGQMPAMRAGSEVPPLPRTRAPSGTQTNLPPVPQSSPPPLPSVRMATAPASRGGTIPPLNQTMRMAPPPPLPQRAGSGTPAPQRISKPTLPPPVSRTDAPSSMPVAAPFDSRPQAQAMEPAPFTQPVAQPSQQISVTQPLPHPLPLPLQSIAMPAQEHPPQQMMPQPPMPQQHQIVPPPQQMMPQPPPFLRPSAPIVPAQRPQVDAPGDSISADAWFEPSRMVEKVDETWGAGTLPVQRQTDTTKTLKKLIAPAAIVALAGVFVGGYFAFNGEGGKKQTAPTTAVAKVEKSAAAPTPAVAQPAVAAPAQPEPVAQPAVAAQPAAAQPEPVAAPPTPAAQPVAAAQPAAVQPEPAAAPPTAAPAVAQPTPAVAPGGKLADVRLDSKPAGATVMLVDNGKTSFLGTAPVVASLDPSRAYDVIFTLEGHPTQMAHVDPTKATRIEVALDKHEVSTTPVAAPVHVAAAPAHVTPAPAHVTAAPAHVAAAPAPAPAVHREARVAAAPKAEHTAAAPRVAAAVPVAGNGVLMVSTKPPCSIVIDGKDTGLQTPQRSITLASGAHKVTLINAAAGIKKTVQIQVTADQPTKLIQNLMK